MSVIAISRQFGAGGKTLAEMVSEKLNYTFFENDIIQMVAKQAKVSSDFVESIEKDAGDKLLKFMQGLVRKSFIDRILYDTLNVLSEAISTPSCVITNGPDEKSILPWRLRTLLINVKERKILMGIHPDFTVLKGTLVRSAPRSTISRR